jgi:hypothetical protein
MMDLSSLTSGPLPDDEQLNRPSYFRGKLNFAGDQYNFGTGGAGRGSIPYGDYPITPNAIGPWGRAHGAIGINDNVIPDAKIGDTRRGIELHAGTNPDLITQGCVAIAGDQWQQFRQKVMQHINDGEKLTLHIGKDGAQILNAKGQDMAQNDNIDIDALTSKYNNTGKTAAPADNIDIDALTSKYNAAPQSQQSSVTPNVEPSKPEFWQGYNDPSIVNGAIPRVGIGIMRGAKDVLDTGAHGLANATSYVAGKLLPEEYAKPIQQSAADTIAKDKMSSAEYEKEYGNSPAANVGRIGGQILATSPLMPVKAFSAIDAAAGALPVAGKAAPLINRLGAAVGKGATGGAIYGAATSSQNDKSLAENVGEGAITGALTGPAVEAAAGAAKGIGGKIVGTVSPTRAKLAQRAEQLGIPVTASQVSTSPLLKKYDQISGMMPFSGAQGVSDNQLGSFTKAVSKTFGEDADEITPRLIASARKKIGSEIEAVGKNSTIKVDPQFQTDITKIVNDALGTLPENELQPIKTLIKNISDKVDPNGNISGEAYTSLTNYKATLSKAQNSTNPNIRNVANEIRNALDDALTRNISPQEKQNLLNARRKYKNLMTIKSLAEADEEGQVSPLRLMQKVMKMPGGKLNSGELGEIADIGRAFFKQPADSGTPLGEFVMQKVAPTVHSPITALAAAAGALTQGATFGTMGEGALALGTNRLMRSAVNSKFVKDSIINSSLGKTHGTINKLANSVVPYSSALAKPRNPLVISDQKNEK